MLRDVALVFVFGYLRPHASQCKDPRSRVPRLRDPLTLTNKRLFCGERLGENGSKTLQLYRGDKKGLSQHLTYHLLPSRFFPLLKASSRSDPSLQDPRCLEKEIYLSLLAEAPNSPFLVYFAPLGSNVICRISCARYTAQSIPHQCVVKFSVQIPCMYSREVSRQNELKSFCLQEPVALGR